MLASFESKPLSELWRTGRSAKIGSRLYARLPRRLDALNAATRSENMDVPGFNFHALLGFSPTRCTVHVNGPSRVTFAFVDGNAEDVDFEQYR